MLHINIPSNGPTHITFSELEKYDLPRPPNGFDAEVNNTVILNFDDEQQAVNYADALQKFASRLKSETSPQKNIIQEIVTHIHNDTFVQSYLQK